MRILSAPQRLIYSGIAGFLILTSGIPQSAYARAAWHKEREQKISEAKHYLQALEKKASEFGKLFKKVTSGGAANLSSDQINNLKSWVRSFEKEYHQTHEKMLDAEDRVHFLDRKIEGGIKARYKYEQLSNERLASLSKTGSKFTQQRVDLLTFLENERDSANKQLSNNSIAAANRGGAWKEISAIMAAASGIPAPPALKPKSRPSRVPANIGQKPVVFDSPSSKRTMKMDFTTPTQKLNVAPISAARGGKLPTALPGKRNPSKQNLMSVGKPLNSKSGASCPSRDKNSLKSLNDGATDFHLLLQGLGKINRMALHPATRDWDIDVRYGVFKSLLPRNSLDNKFNNKALKRMTASEKKRLQYLKYLARVRLIHLYDNSVRKNLKSTYKSITGQKLDKEWSEHFFADNNTDLVQTEWVGGKACKKIRKTQQARGKCRFKMYVRHGKNLFCRPHLKNLKQTAFVYTFDYDSVAKGWTLVEMHVPRVWKKGERYFSAYAPTFKGFYQRLNSKKENLSSIEGWVQIGVPTSDLLGFEAFIKNGPKRSLASDGDLESEVDVPKKRPKTAVVDDYTIDESDIDEDGDFY